MTGGWKTCCDPLLARRVLVENSEKLAVASALLAMYMQHLGAEQGTGKQGSSVLFLGVGVRPLEAAHGVGWCGYWGLFAWCCLKGGLAMLLLPPLSSPPLPPAPCSDTLTTAPAPPPPIAPLLPTRSSLVLASSAVLQATRCVCVFAISINYV